MCRGIILEKGTNRVVCKPFTKFFNYGDKNVKKLDTNSIRYLTKFDGSLVKLYYYNDEWRCASMNCIDINDANMNCGRSLGELLQDAIGGREIISNKLNCNLTYMFELLHRDSRIVIKYEQPQLMFLAANVNTISVINSKEFSDLESRDIGIPDWIQTPPSNFFISLEECATTASTLPWTHEGYVAVDANGNRVKIKSAAYVERHALLHSKV
jgi:hypothetical protein